MGELDGHRHQFRRFVTSKTEHQSLIAGAASIDAHGDVRRLTLYRAHNRTGSGIIAKLGSVVADAANGLANQFVVINVSRGCNFSGHHRKSGRHQRFACDASLRILSHYFVKHCIGNLVGDFVRVAFRNGFRSEQIVL